MLKSLISYIFYGIVFFTVVYATPVNECSEGGLVPEEVVAEGCEDSTAVICPIKFDGIFNITMKFKAPHYLESMKPKLIGKTALGNLEFKGESVDDDVCKGILNTFCPLVEKELIEYRYSAKLVVFPWVPITMEFSILDLELNETAICFNLDVIPSVF